MGQTEKRENSVLFSLRELRQIEENRVKEEEHAVVKDLKQSIGKDVTIKADVHLHHEQFDVMAV